MTYDEAYAFKHIIETYKLSHTDRFKKVYVTIFQFCHVLVVIHKNDGICWIKPYL